MLRKAFNAAAFGVACLEYFGYGVMAVVPPLLTFTSAVGTFTTVSGHSMRPTFNPKWSQSRDIAWVWKWNLSQYEPQSGDIVELHSPVNQDKTLVKRIIATEGEYVRTLGYKLKVVKIPKGHCWVEGDNSTCSRDSNYFGPVSIGLITGRITHLLWPLHRKKKLSNELSETQRRRRKRNRFECQ